MPLSVQSHTGGGGEHHFFSAPAHGGGLRSTLAMGIDVKADGGYVLLPPSSHISGGAYRWREGHAPHEIELARPADWLLEMLARRTAPVAAPPRSTAPQCSGSDDLLSAGQRYVSAAQPADEGARNSAAFRLAGHLAAFETASGERLARA